MFDLLKSLGKRIRAHSKKQRKIAAGSRLEIEELEGRQLLTVTFHGGALLPHVEVQALFYGPDWATPAYAPQKAYLDDFLRNVVHSSYMDMLSKAGYGVGPGSFVPGYIETALLPSAWPPLPLNMDSQLQTLLQTEIHNSNLEQPDSNRLYVIFVQPNLVIGTNIFHDSTDAFLGYHGAFAGTNAQHQPADIRYAVVTYPGGWVHNLGVSWLPALKDMTLVTSHELAEAVTDPDVGYKTLGWYDATWNGEVGDISAAQTVYLNGYAVQRIANQNDQAMTPAGATAGNPVSFLLQANGDLYERSSSGLTFLTAGIGAISEQGIDNQGRAVVDVVDNSGTAYEYHDGSGRVFLAGNVKSAKAGQAVSYLLGNSGVLVEYHDASWTKSAYATILGNSIGWIDAGTDREGVNTVYAISARPGSVYDAGLHSDGGDWHFIASNVRRISGGQQGIAAYVTLTGDAYLFNQATHSAVFLASNVIQVAAGSDETGNGMIELLNNRGGLYEYRAGALSHLNDNVNSISKGKAGLVDVVFRNGDAYEHDALGWHYLGGGAAAAV
jgi:hypothetical protein